MIKPSDIKMTVLVLVIMLGNWWITSSSVSTIVIEHDKDFEKHLKQENSQLKEDMKSLMDANKTLKHEITQDSIFILNHASPSELDSLRSVAFGL